jgi:hypothetical protein
MLQAVHDFFAAGIAARGRIRAK